MKTIAAGVFKAKCLSLLDEVANTRESLLITKRGRPVACVVPAGPERQRSELLRGSVLSFGDLVTPIDESWDAERQ